MNGAMKKLILISIFLFLRVGLSRQQTTFNCDPATDCLAAVAAGGKVPDPTNCEKYYVCITDPQNPGSLIPTVNSLQCPVGQYFDHTATACTDEAINGTCTNECSAVTGCVSVCPPPGGKLSLAADKYSCSSYFLCTSLGPVATTCSPQTPYFNGEKCVADSSQCCDFCTPLCPGAFFEIQDPCDCTSYLFCDENELPTDGGTCPDGTYFNESTYTCDSGTCTSICSNCS